MGTDGVVDAGGGPVGRWGGAFGVGVGSLGGEGDDCGRGVLTGGCGAAPADLAGSFGTPPGNIPPAPPGRGPAPPPPPEPPAIYRIIVDWQR